MHEAVNRRDMDVIHAIVDCKSLDHINQATYDDKTALDMAISRRSGEAQRVLVSAGAVGGPVTEDDTPCDCDRDSDELTHNMDWLVGLQS